MKYLLILLCSCYVLPSGAAFVTSTNTGRPNILSTSTKKQPQLVLSGGHIISHPIILSIRGGDGGGGVDTSSLQASAVHVDAAKTLFGNLIGPAAMLAGGLVPLGFLAKPLPSKTKKQKTMQCLYNLLAVASLVSELMAIMYATVATNKLTEVACAPTISVFALLKRDYELSWIGTNVHFSLGLLGFVSMVAIRALTIFPTSLNTAAAGLAGAALCAMFSILNIGISKGDGRGDIFGGGNFVGLVCRYVVLVAKQIQEKRGGVMAIAAVVLGTLSTISAVRNLPQQGDEDEIVAAAADLISSLLYLE